MKKSGGKRKKTKTLSKVKRKNITYNKLAKQGFLNKDAKRKRCKENRKEKRRTYFQHLEETKRKEETKEQEKEITGEEMMEMMDKDDLQSLFNTHSVDRGKTQNLETIEEEGREFCNFKAVKTKDGREIRISLPFVTETGIQEKLMLRGTDRKGLTLKKYKRTHDKSTEDSQDQDEDSGFGDASDEEGLGLFKMLGETGTQHDEKSVAQILAERKRYLHQQKVKMACLALNVIQDSSQLTNIRFLLNMLKTVDPRTDVTVYKYALYTILQVFHDLIPGYRIQENTLKNRMKKDKYVTARQELDFIEYYKVFLKALEQILLDWKGDPSNVGLTVVSETAIYCLGDLVVRHPSFNYSVNIIESLVPHLNNKHDKVRKLVFDAFSRIIRQDRNFYLSLVIVRKVYKLTHRLRFRVREEVIRVFLALKSKEMKNADQVIEQQRASTNEISHKEKLIKKLTENFRQKPSRRQKKEKKKMAKINQEMESINVAEIKNLENTRQTEIIQLVFGLYIHVLKKRPSSKLMSAVLEGLAKFAHLVNIDFFSDLLALMNKFLEDGTLGRRESLHCIQTIFTILSGQGEALNVDPHRFYNQFYRILIEMNTREREENIENILDILEQMLLQRRTKVSGSKVISFTKRVATLCLSMPHRIAIPVLVKLKKLFSIFSVNEALLDPDPEGCPGMFLPEISDPEHANSSATAVWELVVCQKSYHPHVALLAKNILSAVPTRDVPAVHSITERSTRKLLDDFDQSKLKFNPELPEPTTHLKTVKRKSIKRLFQNGELDLEDLTLQRICEKVLEDEIVDNGDAVEDDANNTRYRTEKNTEENPRKKLKTSIKKCYSELNFYDNIFNSIRNNETDSVQSVKSVKKDFTDAFVDIK